MARPRHDHPTPGELEVLHILWNGGPATGREVWEILDGRRQRHYTSVMSLLNVMTRKGYLRRILRGRAYLYDPIVSREKAVGQLLQDLLKRAFGGSASSLVCSLLDGSKVSEDELEEIRSMIQQLERRQRDS